MEEFPGNSIKKNISEAAASTEGPAAPETSERPQRPVRKRTKKTFGETFQDVFVTEGRNFARYLLHEIIIPDVLDVIASATKQSMTGIGDAISKKISGGRVPTRPTTSYGTGRPVTNYSAYSRTTTSSTTRREGGYVRPARRSNAVERVPLESREIGNEIIEHLMGKIDSTGFATVGDYYDLVDITPRSTDDAWGWDDLSRAVVQRMNTDEYVINFPSPIELPR